MRLVLYRNDLPSPPPPAVDLIGVRRVGLESVLTWRSVEDRSYAIQTFDADSKSFHTIKTGLSGEPGRTTTAVVETTSDSARLYRVIIP